MAVATMLIDPEHSVEAWMNLAGIYPRGDPKSKMYNESTIQICTDHVRVLCIRCVTFFRIGRHYDWKEQYNEYNEYWEKYFQPRGRA
jgi:hypothetical protein